MSDKGIRLLAVLWACGLLSAVGCSSDDSPPKPDQCKDTKGVEACVQTQGNAYEIRITGLAPNSVVSESVDDDGSTPPFTADTGRADKDGRYPADSTRSIVYPHEGDEVHLTLGGTSANNEDVVITFDLP